MDLSRLVARFATLVFFYHMARLQNVGFYPLLARYLRVVFLTMLARFGFERCLLAPLLQTQRSISTRILKSDFDLDNF